MSSPFYAPMSNLMSEKFVQDNRVLQYRVSIPGFGDLGIAPPILLFWVQLAVCVVQQRDKNSNLALLSTYGIIVPSMMALPYFLVATMKVKNAVLSVPLIVLPPLNILRCMEALHGTSRPYVETNFHQFLLYYVSPVSFVFDRKSGKVLKATNKEIVSKLRKLLPGFVETTLLLNLLIATNFCIFPHASPRRTVFDFFHWKHLLNNLALAYLTEIYMEFGTRAAAIVISLSIGLETLEVNDNPLSQSTSVSEFWGKRWNCLVGELLRVGVFKPVVQSTGSTNIAVLSAFLVSGFYHEFILIVLDQVGNRREHFTPSYIAQLMFFLWNGLMLLVEITLCQNSKASFVACKLPHRAKNMLVVMTVLPIAHWFLDEYVAAGLFHDFAFAFPLVRKI